MKIENTHMKEETSDQRLLRNKIKASCITDLELVRVLNI